MATAAQFAFALTKILSAKTIKKDSKIIAVELIVIEIEILSNGIFFNKILMSSIVQIGTPTLPISPVDKS